MVNIIKQYKNLRHTFKQSRCRIRVYNIDRIFHKNCKLETGPCKIAKELILKYCPWYYKYKELFCNHQRINPPFFIDSQQYLCRDGQIINNTELERYDKDLQEKILIPIDIEELNDQNKKDKLILDNEDIKWLTYERK